ncbi:PLP-dependent lyase/thiolase [Desertimonas flava]|uniref:PLP-dependent lyase/thiolase n=1 Tax=Desertimonas flava TaxID=2064846 RepID=UPI000E340A12|nr:PLP-dependent lyase/thiolase [Desertimonas flava]
MTHPTGPVVAWRCAVCAATVDIAVPHAFVCPNATPTDRHHVLHPVIATAGAGQPGDDLGAPNPFVRYAPRLAWWAFAAANGMTESARLALAEDVAAGFVTTPFAPHSLELFPEGATGWPTTVWVKDETGAVGGSHKARHLAGILLHLRAAELLGLAPGGTGARPPLAIASCGNAAIAAATLAQRVEWPLHVFVPTWASPAVLTLLADLGATITECPRRDDDPPGDPAVLRFREAVTAGAIPFSVQGPENGQCLDAGRTLGFELADAVGTADGPDRLDRVVVQVGGGALAACVGWGLGPDVRLDTLQAQGCAPLARAWWRAKDAGVTGAGLAGRWSQLMTPWVDPHSSADGILDDETYDWLADISVMQASGGRPLVAPEEAIERATAIAATTGIPVSATGAAGLAGLLVADGRPTRGERVAVIFSGVRR